MLTAEPVCVVENRRGDGYCQCGRPRGKHSAVAGSNLRPPSPNGGQDPAESTVWDCRRHTVTQPCEDYGAICFRGFGCEPRYAEFSRVDQATDLEAVCRLLRDPHEWNLPPPRLLLSLWGAGPAHGMTPQLQDFLTTGFCRVAVATGAWVITDGQRGWLNGLLAEGIAKEACRIRLQDPNPVVLGISPWGSVANGQALEGAGLQPVPVNYNEVEANRSQRTEPGRVPLNHHHTHFLLVDDGTEGFGRSEAASQFRARLEEHVRSFGAAESSAVGARGSAVVVVVAVGGGVETVEGVWRALARDTPVLLLTPTGGAAHLIQHALGLLQTSGSSSSGVEGQVRQAVADCLDTDPEDTARVTNYLRGCAEKKHLISVFNLLSMDCTEKGEEAFLLALLKPVVGESVQR
ncbi:hypothetical protein ACOMHN_045161 [Nucella lapillus]